MPLPRPALTLLVLASTLLLTLAEDPPPQKSPADAIRERAKADGEKLCPQRGLGGDDTAMVTPGKAVFSEVKIEAEGCGKMTGYVSVPEGLDKARKYALMFVFHGNGDVGKWRVQVLAKVTTDIDPVIVCGVQYQELTEEGKGKMGLPTLAEPDNIIKGSRWLLDKVMKDYPVDPERVFVGGFSWGTAWASGWAVREWQDHQASFPFRAIFLYSSGGAASKLSCPPVPWICMAGEQETNVMGANVLEAVRHFANVLANWGVPVQYHEIPKMGHDVNGRCLQITRDVINELGGPGARPYPSADAAKPDPLTFAQPEDKYAGEVQLLCAGDRWPEAVARLSEVENDRKIAMKDKKGVMALRKEMEKFAQAEIPRLDKILAEAAKAGAMPNPFQLRRQKSLLKAYEKWPWAQKKSYADPIAKLDAPDYPPVAREKEREQALRDAWAMEQAGGKRDEAKAAYEKLAARAGEDGGKSPWPKAAAYRLKWWFEGKK